MQMFCSEVWLGDGRLCGVEVEWRGYTHSVCFTKGSDDNVCGDRRPPNLQPAIITYWIIRNVIARDGEG